MTPADPTAAAFDLLAEAYQAKFMDLTLYDASYDRLGALLPPRARVLELGCGPGNVTRALLRRRPDLQILATDPAPNMLRLAAANNPTAACRLLDARAINELPEQFEAVVAGFCLPYLSAEEGARLAQDSYARLTSGGVLYLSFIEGDYARSGYQWSSDGRARSYVYYYPAEEVQGWLEAAGFGPAEVLRVAYPKADGAADTHCILLAQKQ